jgi:cellulose synthase (UDP-forming)
MTTSQRCTYTVLLVLAWASLLGFLAWWVQPSHLPRNFSGGWHVVDGILFAVLTLVFLHRMFMDAFAWVAAWGIRRARPVPSPVKGLRVAFITTFVPASEPLNLLHAALPAMRDADYPHDVWVLDEGGEPAVRELCESMGVRYFSRHGVARYNQVDGPFAARTKGGNHNAWYDAHADDYDIVAQIDTDFVPRADFLTKTLGHFTNPRVGWVGTPQVYGNVGRSFVARGAAQQLYMFYGAVMRGLAGRGSANMIGANHVVRVAALRGVGFYAGHLTEDLLTGMQLHSRGWKSRYVHEPLAVGEGPATWQAFFNQQMRWAFGCMDILSRHSVRLTRRMERGQRLLYIALQQHYFTGIAGAAGMALLCGYFLGGVGPADVSLVATLIAIAPLVVMRQAIALWLQRFSPSPSTDKGLHWAGRYLAVVTWPVYFLAAYGVARRRRLVFKVTPKGEDQEYLEPPGIAYPHLVLGLVSAACLVVGVVTDRVAPGMLFWAALNTVLMLSFVVVVARKSVISAIVAGQARRAQLRFGLRSESQPGLALVTENPHAVAEAA